MRKGQRKKRVIDQINKGLYRTPLRRRSRNPLAKIPILLIDESSCKVQIGTFVVRNELPLDHFNRNSLIQQHLVSIYTGRGYRVVRIAKRSEKKGA